MIHTEGWHIYKIHWGHSVRRCASLGKKNEHFWNQPKRPGLRVGTGCSSWKDLISMSVSGCFHCPLQVCSPTPPLCYLSMCHSFPSTCSSESIWCDGILPRLSLKAKITIPDSGQLSAHELQQLSVHRVTLIQRATLPKLYPSRLMVY